jgi:hypothetical protein
MGFFYQDQSTDAVMFISPKLNTVQRNAAEKITGSNLNEQLYLYAILDRKIESRGCHDENHMV